MGIVKLYVVDTNKYEYENMCKAKYVNDNDIVKSQKYKMELGKKEHLASDYLKNKYVGNYYYDENEKPLADDSFFNISHSFGYVIMAYSKDFMIGTDIEQKRSVKPDLVKYVSSVSEMEMLKDDDDFYKLWTSKESIAKCQGEGLMKNIKDIPGYPFNGKKEFEGKYYFSKIIDLGNHFVSITVQDENDFEVEIINEELSF